MNDKAVSSAVYITKETLSSTDVAPLASALSKNFNRVLSDYKSGTAFKTIQFHISWNKEKERAEIVMEAEVSDDS